MAGGNGMVEEQGRGRGGGGERGGGRQAVDGGLWVVGGGLRGTSRAQKRRDGDAIAVGKERTMRNNCNGSN